MFFGVRDAARALHNRGMEDREPELPIATARPRRLLARLSAWRGDVARWTRARFRGVFQGRHGVLLLTGIFFSGMMVCMGYVAERANHAADAIDEAQRAQRAERALGNVADPASWARARVAEEAAEEDELEETAPASTGARDHVLFYVVGP